MIGPRINIEKEKEKNREMLARLQGFGWKGERPWERVFEVRCVGMGRWGYGSVVAYLSLRGGYGWVAWILSSVRGFFFLLPEMLHWK